MNRRRVLIIGLTTLLLLGCTDHEHDLQAFVANVRSQSGPRVPPIPKVQPYTPYIFTADGHRSPFIPFAQTHEPQAKPHGKIHPNPSRPLDPLEHFPLDSLTMVGTISAGGIRYALIHAPDDIVYRASVGQHAGHDYGKLTAITRNAVQLSEIVPNGSGGYDRRTARIPMSRQ